MRFMMKSIFAVLLVSLLPLSTPAFSDPYFDQQHLRWAEVLAKYIDVDGPTNTVDYWALKKTPARLNRYTELLKSVKKEEFEGWTRAQQLAFLINAYNAFTLELISKNFPLKNLLQLNDGHPENLEFFSLLGERQTLAKIQNDWIRAKYGDPRALLALSCGSKDCPTLATTPYTEEDLDKQLEENAKRFLSDSTKNRFDLWGNILSLSVAFDTYKDDFDKKYGSVKNFIAPRITTVKTEQEKIVGGKVIIEYLPFDPAINVMRPKGRI